MAGYYPQKGDLVSLNFDPQSGHEQRGRRPALVISNDLFNQKTHLAIVCPITNTNRGYPFHVKLPDKCILTGFVMVEQVKAVDCMSRQAKFIERAPKEVLLEALAIVEACIF